MTFGAKQHFDIIKMLGGSACQKKSSQDFFDKLSRPETGGFVYAG